MSLIEEKIKSLGIVLPSVPEPVANYVPAVITGNLLYTSGLGPAADSEGKVMTGRIGRNLTVDEGYEAARLTGINALSRIKGTLGDLDRIRRVVKLLVMVNCDYEFQDHPLVANGCSDLMVEIFGERGHHARSAVGMGSLPHNMPVEIELIVEIA